MEKRSADIERKTKETDIRIGLCMDGEGQANVDTGVPFFDHMLTAFARHSLMDLDVQCMGDVEVDGHHTVEDVGIVLGQAIREALGDKRGITRFSDVSIVMDEALIMCAMDISGRGGLYWQMDVPVGAILTFDTQLAKEFFVAVAQNAEISLHFVELAGENAHHIIEAAFKAFGRALRAAVAIDPRTADVIPTTKGVL